MKLATDLLAEDIPFGIFVSVKQISSEHAMPLFVKDDRANQLAEKLMALTGQTKKSTAVITALQEAVERHERRTPLLSRIAPLGARIHALSGLQKENSS